MWYMFYTGVKRGQDPAFNEQRIMRSTSTDLYNWSEPTFVLDGSSPLTAWGGGQPWDNDCRDPDVYVLNPNVGGLPLYGMVLSLKQANRQSMIIGVAWSHGDLDSWEIVNVLPSTGSAYARSSFAESPQYLQIGDVEANESDGYVFWTPNDGTTQIIQFGHPFDNPPTPDVYYARSGGKACEIISRDRDGTNYGMREETFWFAYLTGGADVGFNIKIETMYIDDNLMPWFQE
jgi:hypothetical protein